VAKGDGDGGIAAGATGVREPEGGGADQERVGANSNASHGIGLYRGQPARPKGAAPPRSYLYLMVDVGGCKIGISNNPERRRWETYYPSRIADCSGSDYVPPVVKRWYLPGGVALAMENTVKAHFAAHSIAGEWFNISPHEIIQMVYRVLRERFDLVACEWHEDETVLFKAVPQRRRGA
jgi:hypothetical protein